MHYWWKNVVKDYLTFSRKDKVGITVIVVIILILLVLPRYFKTPHQQVNKDAFIQEVAQLNISVENNKRYNEYANNDENAHPFEPKKNDYESAPRGALFAFDPNTLNADGWRQLGVRDKTIQTIQNFLNKGYKFRQPADIKKIYGLNKALADRLVPYVQIASLPVKNFNDGDKPKPIFLNTSVANKPAPRIIDINQADTSDFIMLRGIGSKLASRIVNFRNKLGGFTSVKQLGETYGLPDSTFKNISNQLQCNNPNLQTININMADANKLKTHPYVTWNIANAIVRYREQHGKYTAVTDLLKIEIINEDVFNKLKAYLVVD